jgi:hypothetical protein
MKQQLMNVECFPNLKCLSFVNPCYETNMNELVKSQRLQQIDLTEEMIFFLDVSRLFFH